MQFSLRCDEEILALTHYEKEITILSICWEITAKFNTVPIDCNGIGASFTPNPEISHERWIGLCTWEQVALLLEYDCSRQGI